MTALNGKNASLHQPPPSTPPPPNQTSLLSELVQKLLENLKVQASSAVKDYEKLLQDMDVNRLRAVIYRDVVSYIAHRVTISWAEVA